MSSRVRYAMVMGPLAVGQESYCPWFQASWPVFQLWSVPGRYVRPRLLSPVLIDSGSTRNGGMTEAPSEGPPNEPKFGGTAYPAATFFSPAGCRNTGTGVLPVPLASGRLMLTARGSEKPRTLRRVPKYLSNEI